jgi:hypothetical protein
MQHLKRLSGTTSIRHGHNQTETLPDKLIELIKPVPPVPFDCILLGSPIRLALLLQHKLRRAPNERKRPSDRTALTA